jgi:hypothetical protein
MTASRPLYARPDTVRGPQCTSGATRRHERPTATAYAKVVVHPTESRRHSGHRRARAGTGGYQMGRSLRKFLGSGKRRLTWRHPSSGNVRHPAAARQPRRTHCRLTGRHRALSIQPWPGQAGWLVKPGGGDLPPGPPSVAGEDLDAIYASFQPQLGGTARRNPAAATARAAARGGPGAMEAGRSAVQVDRRSDQPCRRPESWAATSRTWSVQVPSLGSPTKDASAGALVAS